MLALFREGDAINVLQFSNLRPSTCTTEGRLQHREIHAPRFVTSVWVLLRPRGMWTLKDCEMGSTVYRPYPRRLESLIRCRCHYKGCAFSSELFKVPGCWSDRSFDLSSSRTVARYSVGWRLKSLLEWQRFEPMKMPLFNKETY